MKCEASNYTVHVTLRDGSVFSTWIQYLEQEGEPGSAAEHLDCWVHDVHVLTCSWQVGREAPRDVQYHLYLENAPGHGPRLIAKRALGYRSTEQRWPCPQYTANDQGTYVQCRFGNISGFASTQYRLLVNGTSKDSRIRCSELVTPLSYIEKLTAPNMTGSCNESDSIMEWKMSSHLNTNFNYELEIQKGTDAPYIQKVSVPCPGRPEHREGDEPRVSELALPSPQSQTLLPTEVWKTSFVLSSPRVYTARIRALVSDLPPGQWSAPQRFVLVLAVRRPQDPRRLQCCPFPLRHCGPRRSRLGLRPTCRNFSSRRCSVQHKLFPPIPRTKNPLSDDTQDEKMINWEGSRAGQEECPVADVQVLGET
ncbi:interleukin-3 receptor subunit alpha [Pteropus alecto]|uniref:interleukin-3 receptor subunit alpha n=1 Tax=Pteropus alecto TaxID=9402 RepID=UPI000D531D8D|nr:interleukin-3 receptor subunit alpha [Pteropus alecto]